MRLADAAQVALVRAVEERSPEAIAPEDRERAAAAAGDLDSEPSWLVRRAAWLLDHAAPEYRPLLEIVGAFQVRWRWLILPPVVLGALTNYLGPGGGIHALYNPLAILIGWNLAVYLWLVLRRPLRLPAPEALAALRGAGEAGRRARGAASTGPGGGSAQRHLPRPRRLALPTRFLLARVVPRIWVGLRRGLHEAGERPADFSRVAVTFWEHWLDLGWPHLVLAARRALHLSAAGLALGALIGLVARGLVFEYDVVWRSTFLRDPETVAQLLRVLLGPAALATGGALPDAADVRAMMTPGGVEAARWIGLYAVTALAVVVLPRAVLGALAGIGLRRLDQEGALDVDDPYFQSILERAERVQLDRIAHAIRTEVDVESAKFAEGLATFVTGRLYDAELAPRIRAFRQEGGRIADLEVELESRCRAFQPQIERALPQALDDFEASLTRAIERVIGKRLQILARARGELGRALDDASEDSTRRAVRPLGATLSATVGGAVSSAVALSAGLVSGGFGTQLGAAVLVGLLGTTGPVGFLIGAAGGLVVAGGGYLLGRRQMERGVKRVPLPGRLLRFIWRERPMERLIAEGRSACHAEVRRQVDRELEPLLPDLAEQIWQQLRPVVR